MSHRLMRLSEITAEYGERLASRAAERAVRTAPDGEPYLTSDELEQLFADLLATDRDC